MPLLKNYQNDLLKSRTTPLLMELWVFFHKGSKSEMRISLIPI
jgi:hypothetical protein